jgi:hypothetical protein
VIFCVCDLLRTRNLRSSLKGCHPFNLELFILDSKTLLLTIHHYYFSHFTTKLHKHSTSIHYAFHHEAHQGQEDRCY